MAAEKLEKPIDLTWGPPSPSNTSTSETALGVTVGTGVTGGGRLTSTEDGVGGGKQKSIISPQNRKDIAPACTSITALAVARNGHPKMIGIWGISSISMIMKSHGMINLPT